jgi:ribonucleoside-diphosphate reductase alpha chain
VVHAGHPRAQQRRRGPGLPISCFLNAVSDSLEGIQSIWNENVALASNGGGIGTYWGGVAPSARR